MTACTCECTCGAAQATQSGPPTQTNPEPDSGLLGAIERAVGTATGSLALNGTGIAGSAANTLGPNTTIDGKRATL